MTAVAPRKASRREWIGLAVIALPCLLYSMDVTVLNLAVPHISADLRPSSETSSELGGALGIAVLGSIGVAVYRSMMADGVPIGVPPEATAVALAMAVAAVILLRRPQAGSEAAGLAAAP